LGWLSRWPSRTDQARDWRLTVPDCRHLVS
jgi:hypothetical protein